MNRVVLTGNLVADPELRKTQSEINTCSFRIAVPKEHSVEEGKPNADFINCVAWRGQADFLCKYFGKGDRVIVSGKLQSRTYQDKDGNNRSVTEVVCDRIEFGNSKKSSDSAPASENEQNDIPSDDGLLPF